MIEIITNGTIFAEYHNSKTTKPCP